MHGMLELSQLNTAAEGVTSKRQRAVLWHNFRHLSNDWGLLQQWLRRCDQVLFEDRGRFQSISWLRRRIAELQETQHSLDEGSAEPSDEVVTQLQSELRLNVHSGLVDLFTSDPALFRAQMDFRTVVRTALEHLTSSPDEAMAALPLDDEPLLDYDYHAYPEGRNYGVESDSSEDSNSSEHSDGEDQSKSSSSGISSESEQDDSEDSEEHDDSEEQDDSDEKNDSDEKEGSEEDEDNSEAEIDSDEEDENCTDEEQEAGCNGVSICMQKCFALKYVSRRKHSCYFILSL